MANVSQEEFLGGGSFDVVSQDDFLGGGSFKIESSPKVDDIPPKPQERGLFGTVSDVLGVSGLGKGLTQAIFLNLTKEGRDVQNMLSNGELSPEEFDKIIGGELATPGEVIGSAIQTGATLGAGAIGAPKAATTAKRIGESALKFGGISAIAGAGAAIEEGKKPKDITKQAITSGLVGGVLSGTLQSVSELVQYMSSPKITEGLYNKALGISKKTVEAGRSPSKMLLEKGVVGTQEGVKAKSEVLAKNAGTQIGRIIREHPEARFTSEEVLRATKRSLHSQFRGTIGGDDIDNLISKLPVAELRKKGVLNARQLNDLRSTIDTQFLGSARWMNSSQATPERVSALKTVANVMRNMVQGVDDRLPELFKAQSNAITAIRSLNSELAKPHAFTNFWELIFSSLYGLSQGGISPEGAVKAAGALGVIKGLRSTPVQTLTAQALRKTGQIASTPVAQVAGGLLRTGIPGIVSPVDQSKKQQR